MINILKPCNILNTSITSKQSLRVSTNVGCRNRNQSYPADFALIINLVVLFVPFPRDLYPSLNMLIRGGGADI